MIFVYVNRNYVKLSNGICKSTYNKLFQEQTRDWLCVIIETSETKCHELYSFHKLRMCINGIEKLNRVSLTLISFIRNYITASFLPMLPKLSFHHYIHKGMRIIDHNYFSESENSVLSRDFAISKSNNKLHMAYDTIINHVNKKHVNIHTIYAY